MAGTSLSTQSSTGQSTSTSNPIQTPQSEWGLQLSQLLNALASNQYNWAMQQYNTGAGITNENIAQYMQLAGKGSGLADQLIHQYQDQFKPLMDEYIRQAGTYNSEERQRFMAGQAESTVAQADQQARDEAERKLQGFGINPNSGRYQDLMLTSRIQDAAARAGAGTQASLDTADRGRAMTEKAAAMGQNIPGMAVNALQSAYTGVTGAENAILGMINTGANVTGTAAPYFNAASGAIKTPSQGTAAQSTNKSAGQSASVQSNPSQGDKGGSQRQPQQPADPRQPNTGSTPDPNRVISPKTIGGPFQPDAGVLKPGDKNNDDGTGDNPYPMTGTPSAMPYFDDKGNFTPFGDPNLARDAQGNMYTPETTPWDQLPQAPNWSPPADTPNFQPQGSGGGSNVEDNAPAPGAWNPSQALDLPQSPQPANLSDPWGGQDFTPPQAQPTSGDFGQNFWQPPEINNYFPQDQQWQDQPQQDQQPQQDFGPWQNDPQQQDQQPQDNYQPDAGTQDYQPDLTNYDTGEEYARGGRVRPRPQQRGVLPTTGGHVSRNASPSRGRVTDDVPARLNAGEFVIPRDVTAHKGSEFFHRLIANSRKVRTGMAGAPARGKMKPSLPSMRPNFVSRPMGAQR